MKNILIVGLPFFPHKYNYVVDSYKKNNVNIKVLLNKKKTDPINTEQSIFVYAGTNIFMRVFSYFKVLMMFKPKNIDCYDYSILSVFYVLLARALNINVRFWLIGWELTGDKQNINNESYKSIILVSIKKKLTRLAVRFSNKIYAKEKHHLVSLAEISPKLLNKVVSIYNAVPVQEYVKPRGKKNKKDFIYANAVIEKRNVIELIESFNELKEKGKSFNASIYGFNSISNEVYAPRGVSYSEKALDVYEKLNISDVVSAHGFVSNIREIMKKHRFFVLPADIILANYALLESMSLGLVPVVYPGDGFEEIITDGVNGIVVKNNNLTAALELALSLTEEEYNKLSYEAYCQIKNNFSLDEWAKKITLDLV
ncbi:glycosyltransferase family 4 protein [Denitrificimonas sp. JX-1]|uniref:Glycosyltransferase family 4 protein n=1 Tax=Denitrificimonas halotolerans TaxID=3098930 RepID=A0ABU5GRF8_9GAMM|nr:glycosyltransferase family 4 protein [Denitrificimonas sp. JX-1]MDY7218791.1 glycosyltransferase family 4 protein [Denitrificimonas sp. JX-1]